MSPINGLLRRSLALRHKADSRVLPTGEVDDEDRREMSVSAVVSPTGALTMVGFLAVVDCRSPDLGETIATLPPSELEWQPAAHSNGVQCSVVYLYLERVEIAVDELLVATS